MSGSNLVVLGSTGSIGTQTLDIVATHPDLFTVDALAAAGTRLELLAQQVRATSAKVVAVASASEDDVRQAIDAAYRAAGSTPPSIDIMCGPDAVTRVAGMFPDARVVNGMTGSIGLKPTLAALRAGSTLVLANKESLVAGGAIVARTMVRPGQIVPVDSEHSAIAQALASGVHEKGLTSPVVTGRSEVRDIILTASGGPFRGRTRAELADVTPSDALAHPTWDMGVVVTINSSTLVNKALELVEAHVLFDVDPDHIIPVIHPQSIVHSAVTWQDGSTIAQMSPPDMHLPIALGMSWPDRLDPVCTPMDFCAGAHLDFEAVDDQTFPALSLMRQAIKESPTHPAVFNAANEELVDAFVGGRLAYLDIVDTIAAVVGEHQGISHPDVEDIDRVEAWARQRAHELIDR